MRGRLPILVMLGCAAVLTLGLIRLFALRFESGDVYPPYSSLRSDPLGTRALYESLEKIPGMSPWRDHSSANKLPDGADTTYLHLAASRHAWSALPAETFREIERFLARGGRLVITLLPESAGDSFYSQSEERRRSRERRQAEAEHQKNEKTKSGDGEGKEDDADTKQEREDAESFEERLMRELELVSVTNRWGVAFALIDLAPDEDGVYQPARVVNRSDLPIPSELDWHSGVVLTNVAAGWRTLYARGTNAVVVERRFGYGTVVIATDSYFLSNEAMMKDRHADLLAWLLGSNHTIVFDEAHLGVMEGSGVAILMRRYRLHWLMAVLVVLAGLFVWKNATSLAPRRDDEEETREHLAGKDAAAGFVNLLRRNVSPRDLLAVCMAEWQKSGSADPRRSAARREQAEAIFRAEAALPRGDRDPVRSYQSICRALNAKPGGRTTDHGQRTTDNGPQGLTP